jgi:hypothetical protein
VHLRKSTIRSAPGWPDEIVKNGPKWSPIFGQKWDAIFKNVAQNSDYFWNFQKNLPNVNNRQICRLKFAQSGYTGHHSTMATKQGIISKCRFWLNVVFRDER